MGAIPEYKGRFSTLRCSRIKRAWLAAIVWVVLFHVPGRCEERPISESAPGLPRFWDVFDRQEILDFISEARRNPGFSGVAICSYDPERFIVFHERAAAVSETLSLMREQGLNWSTEVIGPLDLLHGEKDTRPAECRIGMSTRLLFGSKTGTIGCRVRNRRGDPFILSNHHVYDGEIGDQVIHVGIERKCFREQVSEKTIGKLACYARRQPDHLPPEKGPANTIDAAIARSTEECLGTDTPDDGYGSPNAVPLGLDSIVATLRGRKTVPVKKYGKTTRLTFGDITCAAPLIRVKGKWYSGQLFIKKRHGLPLFSAKGDSGSLVVTEENASPVGLLFARSRSRPITIANPIEEVLCCLQVAIDVPSGPGKIPERGTCICNPAMRNGRPATGCD